MRKGRYLNICAQICTYICKDTDMEVRISEAYKPETLKDAYRVHIKLSGKKTLAVGITLEDKCIVKTVFVQSKKIQKKVEKWQKKSK